MTDRMYFIGMVSVLVMTLIYFIAPLESVVYVIMGLMGLMGLTSRLMNPMTLVRMANELLVLGTIMATAGDAHQEVAGGIVAVYIAAAYMGSALQVLSRHRFRKMQCLRLVGRNHV